MRQKPITIRLFIGDRPVENLTADERTTITKRMGDALTDYFNSNTKEYAAICREIGGK